jgi:hypothetical protein
MPVELPAPIGAYFAARGTFDPDAVVATFAEDAVVKDEDKEHRGHDAIRAWVRWTTDTFRPTIVPQAVESSAGRTVVSALVSGNFAGSPVTLDNAFTLAGDKIAQLEIG